MRNTHSKFIDKILKEVWSKIDIKLVEGIYTEDFLKSLYETFTRNRNYFRKRKRIR